MPKEFICDDYTPNEQLIRLEQENKELKDKVDSLDRLTDELHDRHMALADTYQETRNVCKRLEQENERLQSEIRQKKMTIMMNNDHYLTVDENNRNYRSALEEIREIIRADCKMCTAECDCDDDCTRYKIKTKINEVLK